MTNDKICVCQEHGFINVRIVTHPVVILNKTMYSDTLPMTTGCSYRLKEVSRELKFLKSAQSPSSTQLFSFSKSNFANNNQAMASWLRRHAVGQWFPAHTKRTPGPGWGCMIGPAFDDFYGDDEHDFNDTDDVPGVRCRTQCIVSHKREKRSVVP